MDQLPLKPLSSSWILVVDDDEAMIQLFLLAAKRTSTQIITANNGHEALKKARNQHFDLIITDLKMPRMNGAQFVTNIRQLPQYTQTPLFVLTANLSEFGPEILWAPHVYILEKPIKLSTIERLFLFKKLRPSNSTEEYQGSSPSTQRWFYRLIFDMKDFFQSHNLPLQWNSPQWILPRQDIFPLHYFQWIALLPHHVCLLMLPMEFCEDIYTRLKEQGLTHLSFLQTSSPTTLWSELLHYLLQRSGEIQETTLITAGESFSPPLISQQTEEKVLSQEFSSPGVEEGGLFLWLKIKI